jgi:hypothetical protein
VELRLFVSGHVATLLAHNQASAALREDLKWTTVAASP